MSGVYIISAPSARANPHCRSVRQIVPGLKFSISYTTGRTVETSKTAGNTFLSRGQSFEEMIRKDEFLELRQYLATTTDGAPLYARAEQEGKTCCWTSMFRARRQIKGEIKGAVSIFVLPPNRQELEKRLAERVVWMRSR